MHDQQPPSYRDQPHHHRPAPHPADLVQQAAPQRDRYRRRRRQGISHNVRQRSAPGIAGPESVQEIEFSQFEAQGQGDQIDTQDLPRHPTGAQRQPSHP